jgi:hypothetical protein
MIAASTLSNVAIFYQSLGFSRLPKTKQNEVWNDIIANKSKMTYFSGVFQ